MALGRPLTPIVLTPDVRRELEAMTRCRSLPLKGMGILQVDFPVPFRSFQVPEFFPFGFVPFQKIFQIHQIPDMPRGPFHGSSDPLNEAACKRQPFGAGAAVRLYRKSLMTSSGPTG